MERIERDYRATAGMAPANSVTKIFLEPVDLVHALIQDRDDTDIAVGRSVPIDEVMFVREEEPFAVLVSISASSFDNTLERK